MSRHRNLTVWHTWDNISIAYFNKQEENACRCTLTEKNVYKRTYVWK